MRSCVACRTARDKRDLLRIVRTPDGRVTIDATGRLPGRGAYVCRDGSCRATALAKGTIARALGVPVPAELRAALEAGSDAARAIDGPGTRTTGTAAHAPTETMLKDEGGARGEE